jgi:uncharacterized metal-binding protein YceD (DUF177 family)
MSELVIHVPDIDETGKDYAFELTHAWLDSTLKDADLRADPSYASGALRVHAQLNGTEFLVSGRLQAHLLTPCGRCLTDAKVPVAVDFATLFHRPPSHRKQPEALELTEDDLQREEFVGHDIVLDDLVREHLVLEVPMQPLCSDACRGIALPEKVRAPEADFGADGVDPRLAPLKRLRDKVPPNKE